MNKKKLILIADDEPAIHESLRLYLNRDVAGVLTGTSVMTQTGSGPSAMLLPLLANQAIWSLLD